MLFIFLIVVVIIVGYFLFTFYRHDSLIFSQQTGYSYFDVLFKRQARTAKKVYTALAQDDEIDHIYVNVTVPGNPTKQVNLIYVHTSGIYVVDYQIVTGWIAGRESDEYWWQLFHQNRKQNFLNPVHLSQHTVLALKELLPEINAEVFKTLIVFTDDCSFQTIELHSEHVEVLKVHEVKAWRKQLQEQILTAAQMQTIKAALQPLTSSQKQVQPNKKQVAI